MKTKLISALALAAAVVSAPAFAAAPMASLDRSFVEYTGEGPIGNNNINNNKNFYWMFESSGTYLGQAVNSWFLFYDPKKTREVSGTVTFDQPILFLFDDRAELKATASFGKPGVTYDYSRRTVGLEKDDKEDTSFAGNILSLEWTAGNPGDHVRVMTAVPEASTYALLAMGLVGICFFLRRRRDD